MARPAEKKGKQALPRENFNIQSICSQGIYTFETKLNDKK